MVAASMSGAVETGTYTDETLAIRLGVSVRHVKNMAAAGKLPTPIRLGRAKRYDRAAVESWIAAGCPSRTEWEARRTAGRTSPTGHSNPNR